VTAKDQRESKNRDPPWRRRGELALDGRLLQDREPKPGGLTTRRCGQLYGEIGCGVQFLSDTLNPGEPS
jgi:hypothetical protein